MELDREAKITQYWAKQGIPEKAISKKGKKFFFLDGPPYATGSIHMGTALNKVLKDYYLRYKRMRGFNVWSQPGYDTHGLPTEVKVEKELGIKKKNEIEDMGVEKFVEKCREFATKHIGVMNQQFQNLGVWMDWDNPYMTLKPSYIEGAWHTFKKGYEKGLFYRGKYPVHICPHCETVVAYNEIEYEKITDTSIYVKFKLQGKDEYLLIWTTTPWTLPANTGVMVHPDYEYVLVETFRGKLWIAKELLDNLMGKLESGYRILKSVKGKKMEGWVYENPLNLPVQEGIKGRVVLSDRYVTLDAGTGLVHTAPGHGQEDYEVGKANSLPMPSPVGMDGRFDSTVGKYSGMFVKDANKEIIKDLQESGYLLHKEDITHDYPVCWRCGTPLLFLSVEQLFFKVTNLRDELIKQNKKANWIPSWAGKRFENWLESLGDWPISRQRYWGTPVPLWVCDKCGKEKVIESLSELGIKDPHRPFIDKVEFSCECGGKMKRVPDVLDVWFDSGVAPWASLGYPKKKELFNSLWPVDFVLEGADQTRGWWNSLAICGLITMGKIPFNNIVQHGLVLNPSGEEMSKSKGTVIKPEEVIAKHGRDVLRYFLLRYNPAEDFKFSWEKCEDVKKIVNVLENIIKFTELYYTPAELKNLQPEDKWVISKINSIQAKVEELNDSFQGFKSLELLENFVLNDFSRWYIKLIRNRTWPTYDGDDKQAALATLKYVVEKVLLMLAPVLPYLTEDANLRLFKYESIHLAGWPKLEKDKINTEMEKGMEIVKSITELCLNTRQEAGIKLRWPLTALYINSQNKEVKKAIRDFGGIVKLTCNVKGVELGCGKGIKKEFDEGEIYLDTTMTDELIEEALAGELVRRVQLLRKKRGLKVGDKIQLKISSDNETNQILKKIEPTVKKKISISKYEVGAKCDYKEAFSFQDKKISIDF
ncbi:MAG: isoleucine--tRNA ligase [Candidatus Diapherotrites archaeon]|nr:isoleucine--tRNA ligase [Candidatus Diapherotrites archaeon]